MSQACPEDTYLVQMLGCWKKFKTKTAEDSGPLVVKCLENQEHNGTLRGHLRMAHQGALEEGEPFA